MKSLSSLDLCTKTPSQLLWQKSLFRFLRAVALGAGLAASTATIASAYAATTATISASGTVVAGVCSVGGANVSLIPVGANTSLISDPMLSQMTVGNYSTNSVSTTISLSATTLQAPAGANATGRINATFFDEMYSAFSTIEANSTTGDSLIIPEDRDELGNLMGKSGMYSVDANVSRANGTSLPAGDYVLTSTLTCVAQ